MNLSIVLDVGALIVLFICAMLYARKGFLASIVVFAGTLASLLLAVVIAQRLSPTVFQNFFQESLEARTAEALGQAGVENLNELLRSMLGFLPESTVNAVVDSLGTNIDFSAANLGQQVVSEVIAPLIIPIISIVVFFVVFALLRVLIGVLSAVLSGINKVPLLGTANRALGGVIGLLIGVLYVFLLLCVIWALDAAYGSGAIGQEYFGTSVLYRIFSGYNIFAA